MARRTFVGNLYKKVKDPSLVGALSGRKEGSKAFARYRDIDEDIKKELVNLIGVADYKLIIPKNELKQLINDEIKSFTQELNNRQLSDINK